jgi:hypothetical protein
VSRVIDDLKRVEERLIARLRELEGNVAEYHELKEVAMRLGILDDEGRPRDSTEQDGQVERAPHLGPRARAARTRGSGPATRAGSAAGRHSSHDAVSRPATRRDRVLELVAAQPGITVRELVETMGVNRTSLYPVIRQLISDGLLVKEGKGLSLAPR